MMCLTCRFASPPGSRFCARCGRGFGCRICPSGHASPMAATWCVVCGKPESELSSATSYIPLGLVARLLAWFAVITALTYVLRHPSEAVGWLISMLLWNAKILFGLTYCGVIQALLRAAGWLIVITLLSFFLPASAGQAIRRSLWNLMLQTPSRLWQLARWLARLVWRIAEGSSKTGTDRQRKSEL